MSVLYFLSAIAFPNIDPVLISLGPLQVHWYGLAYVGGILFAWWYAKQLLANKNLWPGEPPIKPIEIDDFLMWSVIGIILGGRLGYVLFYDFSNYIENPLNIAKLWQGGMSFHGGLFGCILAMILFARSRKFQTFSLLDVIGASAPIGLMLGRFANFINQELYGKITDGWYGVIFPITGDFIPRHPSQIYEGLLEGLVLFFVLRLLTHKYKKFKTPGFIGGAFLVGYAIARIIVEFVRIPDSQIGYLLGDWLTMGMVLSIPVILVGIWGMWRSKNKTPYRLDS